MKFFANERLGVAALALALFSLPAAAQAPVSVGSIPKLIAALSNTVVTLKSPTSPATTVVGSVDAWYCVNPNASSVAYVQIFDAATAGAVTLGTTAPKLSLPVPATATFGGDFGPLGASFFAGIQVAATTGATNGTPVSSALTCNFMVR
jgi:hypothetical protein